MSHLRHAEYFAPRGRNRLHQLGDHIMRHYISLDDKLIGFLGGPGAGKSVLIEGMFPDMTLTNDDQGVNVRPLPILEAYHNGYFKQNTYHVDARFETAFYSLDELVSAIRKALSHERTVIIEHFEKLYPYLNINAQVLIGIGEEVVITRPDIFSPDPSELQSRVESSLVYRKMAHTAEELVTMVLKEQNVTTPFHHSEVTHGFVLEFESLPDLDHSALINRVKELIDANLPISCLKHDERIRIGDEDSGHKLYCTCPRVHVDSTGEISNFRLVQELKQDPISNNYMLIGLVGPETGETPPVHTIR